MSKLTKDIKPLNNKRQAHGLWERYFDDDDLWYKCFFHNGKRVGYEEFYGDDYDSSLKEKIYYI
jgi:hypothetical protein